MLAPPHILETGSIDVYGSWHGAQRLTRIEYSWLNDTAWRSLYDSHEG